MQNRHSLKDMQNMQIKNMCLWQCAKYAIYIYIIDMHKYAYYMKNIQEQNKKDTTSLKAKNLNINT